DVVFFSGGPNSTSNLFWSENTDGFGTFGTSQLLINVQSFMGHKVQVMDMEGDGDLDIAYSTNTYIAWMENTDGLGNFTDHGFFGSPTNTSTGYDGFHVMDVDTDGIQDLIVDFGYDLRCYKHNADGSLSLVETMSTFAQGHFITSADIDNDGDNDVVTIFENGGNNRRIYWFENTDSLGTFANNITLITLPNMPSTSNSDSKSLQLVDVDEDGNIDILFNESSTN